MRGAKAALEALALDELIARVYDDDLTLVDIEVLLALRAQGQDGTAADVAEHLRLSDIRRPNKDKRFAIKEPNPKARVEKTAIRLKRLLDGSEAGRRFVEMVDGERYALTGSGRRYADSVSAVLEQGVRRLAESGDARRAAS